MAATKKKKEPPTVSLSFPEGGGVKPEGFNNMTIGGDVQLAIKGTVKALSENEYEWDPGKRITIEIKACSLMPENVKEPSKVIYNKMVK